MAKGPNQKLKMVYLLKIFSENTDDDHKMTMEEIIQSLDRYGVEADRKTLYQDFEQLRQYGFDIISDRDGRKYGYYLGSRPFELAELKLLVDSVQAAKFITDNKSKTLIKKLEGLASKYEASQLQRQVVIAGRVKTSNKKVFYSVDRIYEAIDQNRQITFHYFQWNEKKEQVLRHDGALYQVSPWCLIWDDEYYYLVAFDTKDQKIKHYRVDKMVDLDITGQDREGQRQFRDFDMARYSKSLFGMHGGEETNVTLEADNDKAGILIDRFGTDIMIIPKGNGRFTAHVNVIPSKQFLGWIFGLGDGIKITGPAHVVEEMRAEAKRVWEQYQ